jgi:hypothetical protein
MKRGIFILETCDEGSFGLLYDYDLLPVPVMSVVNIALSDDDQSVECDIYEQGLQFLMEYERKNKLDLKIKKGEVIEYIGDVQLYNNN